MRPILFMDCCLSAGARMRGALKIQVRMHKWPKMCDPMFWGIASSVQCDSTSVLKDSQMGTFNFMSPEAIQDLSGTFWATIKRYIIGARKHTLFSSFLFVMLFISFFNFSSNPILKRCWNLSKICTLYNYATFVVDP